MKIEVKKSMAPSIIKSAFLIIIGLLLTFMAEATLVSISYILGGVLCAMGSVAIIQFFKTKEEGMMLNQFNIVYGVITILAGVLLIVQPDIVGSLVPICMGLGIIIRSAFKLQQALAFRNMQSTYWKGSMLTSLLCLICGLIILFNPFKTASIVTQVVGIFILIYAILDIISTVMMKKSTMSINLEVYTDTSKKEEKKTRRKVRDAKIIKEEKKGR